MMAVLTLGFQDKTLWFWNGIINYFLYFWVGKIDFIIIFFLCPHSTRCYPFYSVELAYSAWTIFFYIHVKTSRQIVYWFFISFKANSLQITFFFPGQRSVLRLNVFTLILFWQMKRCWRSFFVVKNRTAQDFYLFFWERKREKSTYWIHVIRWCVHVHKSERLIIHYKKKKKKKKELQ